MNGGHDPRTILIGWSIRRHNVLRADAPRKCVSRHLDLAAVLPRWCGAFEAKRVARETFCNHPMA
jgi:hypothetical protein